MSQTPKRNAAQALRDHVARGTGTPETEAHRLVERAAENTTAAQQAEATAPERRRAAAEALRDHVRHDPETAAHLAQVAARIAERRAATTAEEN